MFTGTYTAIVTPFKDGKIDEPSLERLIKRQIKGRVDGIVPVGTTGESPTLSFERVISRKDAKKKSYVKPKDPFASFRLCGNFYAFCRVGSVSSQPGP